jgi:hypothetical protein
LSEYDNYDLFWFHFVDSAQLLFEFCNENSFLKRICYQSIVIDIKI